MAPELANVMSIQFHCYCLNLILFVPCSFTDDSGSGVMVNNTLVGIVESSLGCAYGVPDIHTNVYSYLQWIEIQMKRMLAQ